MITLVDCYTDEPAGLGVPPYLGVYPRYLYGSLDEKANYITIDDLRFLKHYGLEKEKKEISHKTNIRVYNTTKTPEYTEKILQNTTKLIMILGVHTPGKYLSALPGTLKEVSSLVSDMGCEKILTGPAVFGSQLEGGKFSEKNFLNVFDSIKKIDMPYTEIKHASVKGANIIKQIPDLRIIEIETGHGCGRKKGCSFCLEPIKNKLEFRDKDDIIAEVKAFYDLGCRHFRLGKQSDFYLHPKASELLKKIRKKFPEIKVLHIDNASPTSIITKKGVETTKAIVRYCTSGNVAALGVESFDKGVCEENNLNSKPDESYQAIKIINKYGALPGDNGIPAFLPGINLLFGLAGETKDTHNQNMFYLNKILEENLLLRRINIRQVALFEGTELYKYGRKSIRKNKKYYWRWRDDIRQKIDFSMLKKLVPKGTILNDVRMEIYDGNTTFGRQVGTYPLIVGVKKRLPLKKFYSIKVVDHMLRSVVGSVV